MPENTNNAKVITNGTYSKFIKPQIINNNQVRVEQLSQKPREEPKERRDLADQYLENSILTASPQELVLMLFNGAIKFMNQYIDFASKKEYANAHTAIIRAQDIFIELMSTLKPEYEISGNLFDLYTFILDNLEKANFKKETEPVSQMIELTKDLRDTWEEIVKNPNGKPPVNLTENQ